MVTLSAIHQVLLLGSFPTFLPSEFSLGALCMFYCSVFKVVPLKLRIFLIDFSANEP